MKKAIITWYDTTKKTNDDDFDTNKLLKDFVETMKTIGWIWKEDNKFILLAQEINNEKPRDWVIIPKNMLIKREVFK